MKKIKENNFDELKRIVDESSADVLFIYIQYLIEMFALKKKYEN